MATPKQLVHQLYRHWEIVEQLVRLSRELPAFEPERVMALIQRLDSSARDQEPAAVLRELCACDLLQPLGRSDDLQLNPLVLEFVRGLTREHELGLSAVLRARIDAIQQASLQLAEGVEQQDMDLLRTASARLSDLFRQIASQLDQDRHAILELAERAKSREAAMPIAKRYREVLEAYDQYVEPMNQMMDSGPEGSFYRQLEQATRMLDRAEEYLSVRGALYTQRLQLRHVAQQAKELRRLGRVVAVQCADTLLPLREEMRQHNSLSTAIGELLGQVRKRGLAHLYRNLPDRCALPGWLRTRRGRLQLGDEILDLMAQARHFQPEVQAFPEELPGEAPELVQLVDEAEVRAAVAADLPIDNLLTWLVQHYGQLADRVLLRLYHNLVRDEAWQAQLQQQEALTELQQVRVRYHPHRLLLPAATEHGRSSA